MRQPRCFRRCARAPHRVGVDVDLEEHDVGVLVAKLDEHGADHLAGAAPDGAEVDDDRLVAGASELRVPLGLALDLDDLAAAHGCLLARLLVYEVAVEQSVGGGRPHGHAMREGDGMFVRESLARCCFAAFCCLLPVAVHTHWSAA